MVKVKDRMRWGFDPEWVRFPPYLKCKIHHFTVLAALVCLHLVELNLLQGEIRLQLKMRKVMVKRHYCWL